MATVIVGLIAPADVAKLRLSLESANVGVDQLNIVEPDDSAESLARGIAGADIMTTDGGMSIPGINSGGSMRSFFRNETLPDRLGDFEIPDTEMENYVDALEAGKNVAAYFADPENADAVEAAFKAGGVSNVRRY